MSEYDLKGYPLGQYIFAWRTYLANELCLEYPEILFLEPTPLLNCLEDPLLAFLTDPSPPVFDIPPPRSRLAP